MPATITFSDEDCEHIRYGFTDTALALVIAKLDAHDAALDTAAVDGSGARSMVDDNYEPPRTRPSVYRCGECGAEEGEHYASCPGDDTTDADCGLGHCDECGYERGGHYANCPVARSER